MLELDPSKQRATIKVAHLPPSKLCIKPPAKWLEVQDTDAPNNWFNIDHSNPEKWVTSTGKETFEVIQQVDLPTGKILSATMDNPVISQSRECQDEHLINCAAPTSHKIIRKLVFTAE